ncbi:hypothetical protein AK812_SmicGene14990 [Symbiodinium microadriaticum]|uniref:RRM domain-containing protein n=1 Tax=Symbiodinium microadriaticum TaxID=2951 RepID=A0A1Q9E436_SYMMI|nr:hypothetical protein AK812_SmicGene14990 [Symbiodinium microadriaticum]
MTFSADYFLAPMQIRIADLIEEQLPADGAHAAYSQSYQGRSVSKCYDYALAGESLNGSSDEEAAFLEVLEEPGLRTGTELPPLPPVPAGRGAPTAEAAPSGKLSEHLQALFLVPCERAVLRKSEDAEDTKLRRETVTPKRELESWDWDSASRPGDGTTKLEPRSEPLGRDPNSVALRLQSECAKGDLGDTLRLDVNEALAARIEEYEDNKENATILVDFEQSTKLSIQDENMMNMARSKGLRIVFPGRCRKRVGRRAAGQGPATKATLHRLSFLTDLEIESTIMERNTPNDSEELSLRNFGQIRQFKLALELESERGSVLKVADEPPNPDASAQGLRGAANTNRRSVRGEDYNELKEGPLACADGFEISRIGKAAMANRLTKEALSRTRLYQCAGSSGKLQGSRRFKEFVWNAGEHKRSHDELKLNAEIPNHSFSLIQEVPGTGCKAALPAKELHTLSRRAKEESRRAMEESRRAKEESERAKAAPDARAWPLGASPEQIRAWEEQQWNSWDWDWKEEEEVWRPDPEEWPHLDEVGSRKRDGNKVLQVSVLLQAHMMHEAMRGQYQESTPGEYDGTQEFQKRSYGASAGNYGRYRKNRDERIATRSAKSQILGGMRVHSSAQMTSLLGRLQLIAKEGEMLWQAVELVGSLVLFMPALAGIADLEWQHRAPTLRTDPFSVLFAHLSRRVPEEYLKSLFEEVGRVTHFELWKGVLVLAAGAENDSDLMASPWAEVHGKVTYTSTADANMAVKQLSGWYVHGRTMRVCLFRPPSEERGADPGKKAAVYISLGKNRYEHRFFALAAVKGYCDYDHCYGSPSATTTSTTSAAATAAATATAGTVLCFTLQRSDEGKSLGHDDELQEFGDGEAVARRAIERFNGAWVDNRRSFLSCVFFHNVTWTTTAAELKRKFGAYGTVEEFELRVKPNGRSLGMGTCRFSCSKEAKNAIASLDGQLRLAEHALAKAEKRRAELMTDLLRHSMSMEDCVWGLDALLRCRSAEGAVSLELPRRVALEY